MGDARDLDDDERDDSEEPEQFDVHRWAEAYFADVPEVPLELVGVPLS